MLKKICIKRQGLIQSFLSTIKDNEGFQVGNEGSVTMVGLRGIFVTNSVPFIPLFYNLFFINLGEKEGGKKLGEVGKNRSDRDRTKEEI